MKKLKNLIGMTVLGFCVLFCIGQSANASEHGKGRTLIMFKTSTTDITNSSLFAKIDVSGAVTSNSNTGGTTPTATTPPTSGDDDEGDDNEDDQGSGGGNGGGNGGSKGGHGHGHGHSKALSHGNKGHGHSGGNGHGGGGSSNGLGNNTANGFDNFSLAGFDVTLTIGSASFTGTADSNGKVTTPFNAKLVAHGQILMIQANGLDLVDLFPIDPTDGSHQVTVTISVSASKTTTDSTGATTTTSIALSTQDVTFNYVVKNGRAMGKNF